MLLTFAGNKVGPDQNNRSSFIIYEDGKKAQSSQFFFAILFA